jgi:MarR family 2-MHQ and catechol resistance regulon transcriptional repressor
MSTRTKTTIRPAEAAAATPADSAFRSLVRTLGLLKRVMEPYFSRFGISGSQWSVLRTLHRSEQEGLPELRLTDLGGRLIVRPPSVTGVVDRLQRMGLVRRAASPDDQRAKHVSLTAAGRQLVRRVLEHHPAQIEAVLGGLKQGEQEALGRLLERLATHLEATADERERNGQLVD